MEQERHLVHSLEELRDDLKAFIQTRYEILRAELSASVRKAKMPAVGFGVAAVFGFVGLLLLGFCASLAIGLAFGAFTNQVGLVWGFLIVGVCSVLVGAMAGAAAMAKLKSSELAPKRTMQILKRDQEILRQGVQYGESERFRRRA